MDAKELAPEDYLAQFLGKTLRVYTNDDRMFSGTMRCTDKVFKSIATAPGRSTELIVLAGKQHHLILDARVSPALRECNQESHR